MREKLIALLFFVDMVLLAHHLRHSYLIVSGVFFLSSIGATAAALALITLSLLGGLFMLTKRYILRPGLWFAGFLCLNSLANLGAVPFVAEDMAGFLTSVFSGDVLAGFVLLQALFAINNFVLFLALRKL